MLLKNGVTATFDFDIAEQMKKQPRGGVLVIGGLEVEMSDEPSEEGGFGVDVDDWGEVIIIPLPIHI